ncbi:MAG: nitrate/nitrite transporter NrtS [Actinomycetota bacterium]|nr:nitrate/nitrite transporter NrtS [Actinomycetota bacterium]
MTRLSAPTTPLDPASHPLSWGTTRDIPRVVFNRSNLMRTIPVALVVGSVLFAINQLDVVLSGKATTGTWIKGLSTYVVPFCVANYGVLSATRRRTA